MGFPRLAHLVALLLVTLAPLPAAPALSLDAVTAPSDDDASAAAPAADTTRAIVHFHEQVEAGALRETTLLYAFVGIPAAYVAGPEPALAALAMDPRVRMVEPDFDVEFLLDTATKASRARDVWASPAPLVDAHGNVIDGRGVGIAIVDSGLDATHPDFAAQGKVGGNWLATPAGLVAAAYTNEAQAHGTHVAGIAAGTGAASGGLHAGAAPGATLYAFAIAPAGTVAHAAIAFDWILQHGHEQQPPIRVVSNSWGCASSACRVLSDPPAHVALASRLAEAGYVVTWAAGNDGGRGLVANTNVEARNPTPGILTVASYNDAQLGLRDQCLAGSSSRGAASEPLTWPDVAAPGVAIFSTWAAGAVANSRVPMVGRNTYRELSGTSMAAPHVAGIAALMLQANATLAPGDVEHLLKATATKLACGVDSVNADPTHTYDGANYAEGHGLVDARAAVEAAFAYARPASLPLPEPLTPDFLDVAPGVRVGSWSYLAAGDALAPDRPAAGTPRVRVLAPNQPVVHESPPLLSHANVSGFEVNAWIGTLSECPCAHLRGDLEARVERVNASGVPATLATRALSTAYVPPGAPVLREWTMPLAAPVALSPGDSLRLSLTMRSDIPSGAPGTWVLYSEADATPSRLGIGQKPAFVLPWTAEGCAVREDCARIGADREAASMYCAGGSVYRIVWEGPAGSSAFFTCSGATTSCTVPEDVAGGWGRCEAVTRTTPVMSSSTSICGYRTPDGLRAGVGRCEGLIEKRD